MKKTKIILPMVVFALSSCGPTGDPSSFSPSTESPSTSESTSVVEPEEPMDDGLYFNEDIVNFKAKTISQELSDGTSNAKATWEAEYLPEGVLIKVKVLDPNIFAGKNFFSSDYAEVQIQAFDSSYVQDFHTYNFICNTNGQVIVREYNKGYKEITPFTSDFSNEFSRTSGGYNYNLLISYNLLKTTYQNAVGNVRIYTSMKNSCSDSVGIYQDNEILGSTYQFPNTWFVLNKDNEFIRKDFETFSLGESEITNNLANISSNNGTKRNVTPGTPCFYPSNICFAEYGIPTELMNNSSFIRGDKSSVNFRAESNGYVIIAANVNNSELNSRLMSDGFTLLKSKCRGITTVTATNSTAYAQMVNYYYSYVNAGFSYNTPGDWSIVFGKKDTTLLEDVWLRETPYTSVEAVNDPFYQQDNNQFSCGPSIQNTKGGRLFASYHIGGAYEPLVENCFLYKYSDDKGITWKNGFVIDSWVDKKINTTKNVCTMDQFIALNKRGELLIFYVLRENINDGQSCNMTTWMTKLINPDANPSEWTFGEHKKICEGYLAKNRFKFLSDGSLIMAAQSPLDERFTYVLKSYDDGDNWEVVNNRVYAPQAYSYDEPIIMERDDGSLFMTYRTRRQYMYYSESFDKGLTWTVAKRYFMPNTDTRFAIEETPNGEWIMIYNNSSSGRTAMTLAISYDEGKSWENKILLYEGYCSYPDMVIMDGDVHLAFDDGRYKQYQWRTEDNGNVKTWGYIYHHRVSLDTIRSSLYYHLPVTQLDVVYRCAEYSMNYLKGSGTETDPYLINDFNAWKIVCSRADTDNFNGKYLKLTNNIEVYGNIKIGRNDNPFNGVFDGNNYKINVNYNHSEGVANQGTFGTIGSNAVIKNVTITGEVIASNPNSACIGGLVGVNKGGTIINCHNEANVTASGYNVGGLVGIMDGGSISSSTNKGTISSSSSKIGNFQRGIGGIVGTLTNVAKSTITDCQNSGVITAATTQLGGIVGFATGSSSSTVAHQIVDCVNNGDVTSTKEVNSTSNEGVAGIVGMACWYVQITRCTNNATITALSASQVAGIVGKSTDYSVIDSCTNNGDIYGYNQVGGISGRHVGNAVIKNCTNTGDIYGVEGVTYGQIAGHNGATIETNNNENGSSQKYNK